MNTHEFGGDWTTDKLERLRKYLEAYTKIFTSNLRARNLSTIYVDAFAGTGYRTRRKSPDSLALSFPELAGAETEEFLKGSARIALEIEQPFRSYVFIEADAGRAQELEKLKRQFPQRAPSVQIVQQDANGYLRDWCGRTDWRSSRAVVFLDPYGMEVDWATIRAIARTQAIDLWYLFPLGPVMRLLTAKEPPPEAWAQRVTRTLGTDSWHEVFYQKGTVNTLFGQKRMEIRDADFERVSSFFVERLKAVFPAVAENPLPLRNSKNTPLYLLCFAACNPRGAVTALKIARYILGR